MQQKWVTYAKLGRTRWERYAKANYASGSPKDLGSTPTRRVQNFSSSLCYWLMDLKIPIVVQVFKTARSVILTRGWYMILFSTVRLHRRFECMTVCPANHSILRQSSGIHHPHIHLWCTTSKKEKVSVFYNKSAIHAGVVFGNSLYKEKVIIITLALLSNPKLKKFTTSMT